MESTRTGYILTRAENLVAKSSLTEDSALTLRG